MATGCSNTMHGMAKRGAVLGLYVMVLVFYSHFCVGTDRTHRSSRAAGIADSLTSAVDRGDLDRVRELVTEGADVGARDSRGQTPLYVAADNGRREIAELLLGEGASPNAPDGTLPGSTPLTNAIERGDHVLLELLLDHGASMEGVEPLGIPPDWVYAEPVTQRTGLATTEEWRLFREAFFRATCCRAFVDLERRGLSHQLDQVREPLHALFRIDTQPSAWKPTTPGDSADTGLVDLLGSVPPDKGYGDLNRFGGTAAKADTLMLVETLVDSYLLILGAGQFLRGGCLLDRYPSRRFFPPRAIRIGHDFHRSFTQVEREHQRCSEKKTALIVDALMWTRQHGIDDEWFERVLLAKLEKVLSGHPKSSSPRLAAAREFLEHQRRPYSANANHPAWLRFKTIYEASIRPWIAAHDIPRLRRMLDDISLYLYILWPGNAESINRLECAVSQNIWHGSHLTRYYVVTGVRGGVRGSSGGFGWDAEVRTGLELLADNQHTLQWLKRMRVEDQWIRDVMLGQFGKVIARTAAAYDSCSAYDRKKIATDSVLQRLDSFREFVRGYSGHSYLPVDSETQASPNAESEMMSRLYDRYVVSKPNPLAMRLSLRLRRSPR